MKTCSAAPLARAESSEKKNEDRGGKKGAKSAARQGKEGDDPVHLCARVS